MIEKKGEFYSGMGLMGGFVIVLIMVFMPLFNGQNGLDYLDALYNSISKGSAYYIPGVKEKSDAFKGEAISVALGMATEMQARRAAALYMKSGAMVNATGKELKIKGDLGRMLENCLADAEKMYHNDGKAVSEKYGHDEKRVLFNWWMSLKIMEKELKAQEKFKEAKIVALVLKKAVETSYNYYKIEPQKIRDKYGIVLFSLIFYVLYTLWYGFAILFMFEGWGLKMGH
ncbi:MAG: hypothetical protein GY859_18235 [Desulfobacterales bacterium]|nr:hypothetical protein [Desulfobacterales bacterium]